MIISKSKINSGDLFEVLKFAYVADTENFKKAFEKYGFEVNSEDDLKTLAELSRSGADKSGKIQIAGKPIIFDVKEILKNIDIRYRNLQNSGIMSKLVD